MHKCFVTGESKTGSIDHGAIMSIKTAVPMCSYYPIVIQYFFLNNELGGFLQTQV